MPISKDHHELFHNSSTLDKINLFQTLLDSKDLTSMEALALLNTVHMELEKPQHAPAVYTQYAEMMEALRRKMPDLYEEVYRKWSDLQIILKSRGRKEQNVSRAVEAGADDDKKRQSGFETPEQKIISDLSQKPAIHAHKDFELDQEVEAGGAEGEEGEAEEEEDEEKEPEKEETEEEKEEEAEEETEEKEKEESKEEEAEEDSEEKENEEKEKDEVEEEVEEEKETEKEESESEEESEEGKREEKEETGKETEKVESEEKTEMEVEQKETTEESDHMAGEAAEAVEHFETEIEPAEEEPMEPED